MPTLLPQEDQYLIMPEHYSWRDRAHKVLRWIPLAIEYKLRVGAKHISNGHVILMPSETVNTFSVNGRLEHSINKIEEIKGGRQADQRGGIISSPQRFLKYIDFEILNQLNPGITLEGIKQFFNICHGGLVLPCKKGVLPEFLTLECQTHGLKFPTALFVWNDHYKIWCIFEKEISRHSPEIIWVGSSANIAGEPPQNYQQICNHPRINKLLRQKIRDKKVEKHPFPGSYTLINAVTVPPSILREGNMKLATHPEIFKRWNKEVFGGKLQLC